METVKEIYTKELNINNEQEVYIFPASLNQKYLWDEIVQNNDSTIFNISFTFNITGGFNYIAFCFAINKVIERHESLRTIFNIKDGTLFQVIKKQISLDIPVIDLRKSKNCDKNELVERYLKEMALTNFDFRKDTLLKVLILQIDCNNVTVIITLNEMICDSDSIQILLNNIGVYYNNFIGEPAAKLNSPILQYADLVMFNSDNAINLKQKDSIEYWKNSFGKSDYKIELYSYKRKTLNKTYCSEIYTICFNYVYSNLIKEFSTKTKQPISEILFAAYIILLYKYTYQKEIIVGYPFSNRLYSGTEEIVGNIQNNLPIKIAIDEKDTISILLNNIKESILKAKNNQDVTFSEILNMTRSSSIAAYHPLYQAFFNYKSYGMSISLCGQDYNVIKNNIGKSFLDISLNLYNNSNIIEGFIEYSSNLFDKSTIERMAKHFLNIVNTICTTPEKVIDDICITLAKEKKLFESINDTKTNYPTNRCIHTLFEEQVFRTPDSIALQFAAKKYTYLELNERANSLSNYLCKMGVEEGDLVGVSLEKSIDIPIVLLAILKSGAAYIPLDPNFPVDRLNYMVEDAKIKYIVTTSDIKNILASKHFIDFILLDIIKTEIYNRYNNRNISKNFSSNNLCYILYTSGTTGRPKGVKIQHKAFINFLFSMSKNPGICRNDILLSVTTLSFDIAGLEIFLPLLNGAKTVIASKESVIDASLLAECISKNKVTFMQATPATWKLLVDSGWKPENYIKILCGGEALSMDLAQKLLLLNGELWNMYGPTETCVWSSVKRIYPDDEYISIGKPIANTEFFILDKNMNQVPIGIPGDLFIGGYGLSSGYLNREDLTKQKFIQNPFSNDINSKLYKTGDIAKYHEDGNVECLGRSDFQIKIRGFRIEVEEIEKQLLLNNENIKQAVVVAKNGETELTKLVAFLISRNGHLNITSIRNNLKQFLPDYMIPNIIVEINQLPFTPNNKVDRKALIELNIENQITESNEYIEPSSVLEFQLSKIWENILQRKNIGITDNFFDLGGHSLMAAKLFSKINETLNIKLPLAVLFNAPTIKELCEIIKKQDVTLNWSPIVPIKTSGKKKPLFLIHGAEGNVLIYRNLIKYLDNELPVYGIQSQGLNGLNQFNPNFESIAAYYLKEIKKIQPQGPYLLGGYCLGGTIALEIGRQLKLENQKVSLLAMFESYNLKHKSYLDNYFVSIIKKFQNVYFHLLNVIKIERSNRMKFLREKYEVAKFRLEIKIKNLLGYLLVNNRMIEKYPHLKIKKMNDEAEIKYIPQEYSDEILLFKPYKNFIGMQDHFCGWGELAKVKVCQLSIYPKGMLVEPFVKILAEKLTIEINNEKQ